MANKKFLTLGTVALFSILGLAGCKTETGSNNSGQGGTGGNSDNSQPVVTADAANGAFNYQAASYDERAKIIAALEKYAMDNNITGISLYDDGGEVIYNNRLQFPVDNYVNGYGTGLLREGDIVSPSINDSETQYGWYLHYFTATFPTQINGANDSGSEVSDYDSMCHSVLYGTRLVQKNGEYQEAYEWYPVLASDMPTPIYAADGSEDGLKKQGLANTYRIHIRTGAEYTYDTASSNAAIKKFKGREIAKEDYEFAMRMLLSGDIGFYRASQYTSDVPIKGAAQYYNISRESGWKSEKANAAWENVGFHVGTDSTGDYIDITFQNATTPFYAMYQTTSFTTPVPQDFFELVTNSAGDDYRTAANYLAYGGYYQSKNYTPIDTYLSVGPYTLERWDPSVIAFRQNPDWYEVKEGYYKIKGVKYRLDSGMTSNERANYDHFVKGECDSTSIPDAVYDDALSKGYTIKTTPGTSNFKMNVNSCNEEEWEKLFGVQGTITQTQKADYWDVKPIMSNNNFLKGLFFGSNRQEVANYLHRNPAFEYFSDNYLVDPESGVSYNDTEEHKAVIADYAPDSYGYSASAAQSFFNSAIEEEVAAGHYKQGDTITLVCYQQSATDITGWGPVWINGITNLFNTCTAAQKYNIKLAITQPELANWSDVYYAHAMVGQFDLAFGSVSGNALDPLNFLEVLKSDNSSGFTLNWGVDTSKVDPTLVYDGKSWSFDALWNAGNNGTMAKNGEVAVPYIYKEGSFTVSEEEYIPEDEDGNPQNDKAEMHTFITFTLGVDTELLDAANVDLTTVDDTLTEDDPNYGKPADITDINFTASVYDPNNSYKAPTAVGNDGSIVYEDTATSTFSVSGGATHIKYDAATASLTFKIDLDQSFTENLFEEFGYPEDSLTDAMETANKEYHDKLIAAFTSGNGVSMRFSIGQNMTISEIPSTQYVSMFVEDNIQK